MLMLEKNEIKELKKWIKSTNRTYREHRQSCSRFEQEFNGYFRKNTLFHKSILHKAYFVPVNNKLPLPRELGFLPTELLEEFSSMDAITYDNVYYIRADKVNKLNLHFHELVHVIQYRQMGISKFLERYMSEISNYGYDYAPLEKMAYELEDYFQNSQIPAFDLKAKVRAGIKPNQE